MLTAIIGGIILLLIIALVIIVARDPGPSPTDVAVAYEAAWSRLDFNTLWTLSGYELRDGMNRVDYELAKKAAYTNTSVDTLAPVIAVESLEVENDYAVVKTSVVLSPNDRATNEINFAHRRGRWLVVGYRIISSARTS